MANTVIYRLINKSDNKIEQYRSANKLSSFMLGRRISSYIVIKSDEKGDRIVDTALAQGCVNALEVHLVNA